MKHPSEMPDEILISLGFVKKPSPYSDGDAWTHPRAAGKFYYHILSPDQVTNILIEIGHGEFRRRAASALSSIDMDNKEEEI